MQQKNKNDKTTAAKVTPVTSNKSLRSGAGAGQQLGGPEQQRGGGRASSGSGGQAGFGDRQDNRGAGGDGVDRFETG
jgi:hypothetical protein